VAVIGKLDKNRKETSIYKRGTNTKNNAKKEYTKQKTNIQNWKTNIKNI